MKIKKVFAVFTVLAIVLFVNISYSQDLGKLTPEERAQKRADKMNKHLSLSDEQYKQVYDAFLSQAKQVDALKSKDIDKSKKKEEMKLIRKGTDEKIGLLLNKDQAAKYDKFKEKRKEKHMHKKKMKKQKKNKQKQLQ